MALQRPAGRISLRGLRRLENGAGTILPSTVYTLQYIVSSPVEKLYTFVVKEEVLDELEKIVADYLEKYVDRHFKSLEILKMIVE